MGEKIMKGLWCPLLLLLSSAAGSKQEKDEGAGGGAEYHGGTIVISSVGRAQADFGLYFLPFPPLDHHQDAHSQTESQLIAENDDGTMRYNGYFVSDADKKLVLQGLNRGDPDSDPCSMNGRGCQLLAYVSEEEGTPQVYFGALDLKIANGSGCSSMEGGCHYDDFRVLGRLSDLLISTPVHVPFQDRPSVAGGRIVYVGMRQPPRVRRSWSAVFSKDLTSGTERRLTLPDDAADFSPALSPCGKWVIVASDKCHGFNGEMCILNSDLYMFSSEDGSQRRLLIKDGGWPCWAYDGSRFFFHRRVHDGWWSVFEAHIPSSGVDPVLEVKRLTGPGFHAFTPAAAASGPAPGALEWIVVATRRPGSEYRQIEILILQTGQLIPLTHTHCNHYNPFVLPDGSAIGYHRCTNRPHRRRNLEYISSPLPNTSLLRIDGDFPSFSRDGSLIAFTPDVNSKDAGVDVMRVDGSRRRTIFPWKVSGKTFGTAWHEDGQGNAVVYTSIGQDIFMTDDASTYIVAIVFNASKLLLPEDEEQDDGILASEIKVLTRPEDKSNAFPSPSPDGKELVVSSSRSGYRNLYILDAQDGSVRGRLTEGEWTDTMCDWSAANGWIAFSSNRESRYGAKATTQASHGNGDGYGYGVFLVHPNNKSNVVQVTNPGLEVGLGIAVHPKFSPDGKSLLLTADYAGLSAEPVASGPNQFQPYGEVYVCSLDWSHIEDGCVGLKRLTFSPYETSLAAWGKVPMTRANIKQVGQGPPCRFHDPFWLRNTTQEVRLCVPSNALGRYPPDDYLADLSLYENLRNISLHHKLLSNPIANLNQSAYRDEL